MTATLYNYLLTFMHPFRTQKELRRLRESQSLHIAGEVEESEEKPGLSWYEGLTISWLFYIMHAFYSLVTVHLGFQTYRMFNEESDILQSMFLESSYFEQRFFLIRMLFWVILFPFTAWVWVTFWTLMIKFFANLFECKGDIEAICEDITHNALSSHTMLIIPIFGSVAQHIAGLVFIFAGLRNNLGLNTPQSLAVMLAPLFLFLLLIFITFLSIAMLFVG